MNKRKVHEEVQAGVFNSQAIAYAVAGAEDCFSDREDCLRGR